MQNILSDAESFRFNAKNPAGEVVLSLEFHVTRGLVVYDRDGTAVFSVGVEGSTRGNHIIAQGNFYKGENTEALNLVIGESGFHSRSADGNSNVKVLGQQSQPIADATTPADAVEQLNKFLQAAREQGWLAAG